MMMTMNTRLVCSRIDYCNSANSLLIGLPKVRLFPIPSVLNAAARLHGWTPSSYVPHLCLHV